MKCLDYFDDNSPLFIICFGLILMASGLWNNQMFASFVGLFIFGFGEIIIIRENKKKQIKEGAK